jgi:hypothetical protein
MNGSLPATLHFGFLTVASEAQGFLGGYLVTNSWGRPLEFRLSTAVQPNKVQQILYGTTLTEYLCADLIGKTLVEKTSIPPHLIVTDTLNVLPLRGRLEVPVLAAIPESELPGDDSEKPLIRLSHGRSSYPLVYEAKYQADDEMIRAMLDRLDRSVELTEPFTRIREAMGEARKMGVTSRAA